MLETTSPRVRALTAAPVRAGGDYVLYWMVAARRTRSSPALDRALGWARELRRPLVVLEALRCDYPHASDRMHQFVLEGMRDNAAAFAAVPVTYHPYVEPERGHGKGLLRALAARACVVITDDAPAFFLPRMIAAAAQKLEVRLEAVDGYGLVPLHAAPRAFPTARGFRRFVHDGLEAWLRDTPAARPLARLDLPRLRGLPVDVRRRWAAVDARSLAAPARLVASLPIDHAVAAVPTEGGAEAARARLRRFVREGLPAYERDRDHPDAEGGSGLSPYLHFGHLGAHEVLAAVRAREDGGRGLRPRAAGQRRGFWGLSSDAEAFLDQLVTWRELGANAYVFDPEPWRWEALPAWARATLERHRGDARPAIYDRAALEGGDTSDPLWNAAQRQLVTTGVIHGYLRMLWGKLVLAWTRAPEDALALLLDLNDRWAIDGRDANSYSGIAWCFGRYDRPWGPERPIYGTVRYMTSASARRKLRLREYLERFGDHSPEA